MFAALGGALVSCSDDEDIDAPGPGEATGGAADAGAPSTSGGSDTGGLPATGGAVNAGGQAGAESTTGGSDGGADSATGGASAGEAGETSATGGSSGGFPSSCGKLLGFSECDPVTGFPCDLEAGETCDLEVMLGAYTCFEGPNDATFCGSCDPDLGEFCGAGTTCNFDYPRCEHYCCDDSDCASGTCLRNPFALEDDNEAARVGVCAEEAEAMCTADGEDGEGGAGAGGAGSSGAGEEFAGSGGAG
jgi:hypothetical protein